MPHNIEHIEEDTHEWLDEDDLLDQLTCDDNVPEGLPTDPAIRKSIQVYTGFVKYFPLAMVEVAKLSAAGNEQHNPGAALHWDRSKSPDELDSLMRHLLDHAINPNDIVAAAAVAWRAMANLQKLLEKRK